MSSKSFFAILLFLLPIGLVQAQNSQLKPLNHKKWEELVKEVKSKRYDRFEKEAEYQQSPEQEYEEYERDLYGDDEYSEGGGNGTGGGNGSGGSGNYSSSDDQGIYDGSSNDDKSFFDEKNDRSGDGSSQGGTGDGDGDVDPRYNDDQQGHSKQYSKDPQYEQQQQRRIIYDQPKAKTETREAGNEGGDSTWLIIIMIVLAAAAVIYMIVVAFNDRNKKVKAVVETDEHKMENLTITKSELELALEAALANKNYREAVRIYFIAIIKEMKDRSWIRWEKKKTNYHYINEISGRKQQPDFITATRAFEIVWYGNRSLDEKDYRQLEPHFKKLLQSIHA